MEHHKKKVNIIGILVIVLGIVMIINLIFTFGLNNKVIGILEKNQEASKPAEISLTLIKTSSCDKCFNIDSVVSTVKSGNVKVLDEISLNENDARAKEFISNYNIEKLPTVLINGEIDKLNLNGFTNHGDILEFTQQNPPYYDLSSKETKGLVQVTLIKDSSCKDCTDLNILLQQFKTGGVVFSEEDVVEYSDASDLISKYKIEKIPSLILSKDASVYTLISSSWQVVGTIESDGSYVFRNINPPYRDVKTSSILGLVKLTYLNDKSCGTCYNVLSHKNILDGMGIKVVSEETIDTADKKSQDLIKVYNITKVPTIIISKEIAVYNNLSRGDSNFLTIWKGVGTVEKDGTYIFRNTDIMGVYKDLNNNELVTPQTSG